MAEFDVVIRGGTVVDGTRVPAYRADVGIRDGRIAQIGGLGARSGDREIEAGGHIVAPGFVDLHTHYDAQIQWDPYCTISGWHGVTSVVLGNCGFGFAPVKPDARERAMLTMSRTEAIPLASMRAGMLWDWETFPEWLDTLERIPKGINALSYVPLSPLMIYVMGLEAAKSRPANEAERREMKRLFHEAMDAGACGWSMQRLGENSIQADFDGSPMVTDTMVDEDAFLFAEALRERDEGFIQITQLSSNPQADLEFQEKLAEISGRPVLHNLVAAAPGKPEVHRAKTKWLQDCNERGLRMFGQGATIRTGFAFTLEHWNLYDASPAWNEATTGTYEEKVVKLSNPELRERIKQETEQADEVLRAVQNFGGPIEDLVVTGVDNRPGLEEYVGLTLADVAKRENKHPLDAMLDLSLETDLRAEFQTKTFGTDLSASDVAEMVTSPYVFAGVSDGGAHTKFFCGGSYTTDFLTWLVRDAQALSIEEAIYRLSYLPAHAAGFQDRGMLRVGSPADVVVFELDRLRAAPEFVGEIAYDFPGNEWRRVQKAEGYRAVLVNGGVTFEEGECTGATPGKLLRHGHA